MCKRSYLVVSGVIFGVVALFHLARLAYHFPVQIGEWNAPMWPSWPGLFVGAILSIWAFSLLCGKCDRDAQDEH